MKVALVGNQNSGKTTLFNYLTGMNAKIGNWPGVTIEKKTGKIKGTENEITDLPGIYSLSPYSTEEEVSRQYIFEENPDVIINIVDSTTIERSLYLTTQLMELDTKLIIALNMTDILEKKGIIIDEKKLEEKLGVKVFKISALKETGIDELIKEVEIKDDLTRSKVFDDKIEKASSEIENELNEKHNKFVAIKLLERDNRFDNFETEYIKEITENLQKKYDTDLEEIIATERYEFIEKVKKESVERKEMKESSTDKLDRIFLNKWIAFPIFTIIMFLVYYLSVGVIGSFTVDWVGGVVESFGQIVEKFLINIGASNWSTSLVVDGIIAGCGAVLGFVPQLIILFLCISILETTGYMSRVTFLLDKLFKRFGLSGETLVPFIVGLRVLCSRNNVNKNNKR